MLPPILIRNQLLTNYCHPFPIKKVQIPNLIVGIWTFLVALFKTKNQTKLDPLTPVRLLIVDCSNLYNGNPWQIFQYTYR